MQHIDNLREIRHRQQIALAVESFQRHRRGQGVAQRERKLNMVVTVLMLIVMHFYSNVSQDEAMRKASKGYRWRVTLPPL